MENLVITNLKEREIIYGQMVEVIKVIGKMVKCMGKVVLSGAMVKDMKEGM